MALAGPLPGDWLSLAGTELWRSLLLTWLIAEAVYGLPGWTGRWLASTPARTLGLWSYAIYLSHNFIRCGVGACATGRNIPAAEPFLALLLTLVWSSLTCRFADIIKADGLQKFFSMPNLFFRQRTVLRDFQPSSVREENRD
jgi:peptidoglycan/LPS O-acetylase OafA/YrhL